MSQQPRARGLGAADPDRVRELAELSDHFQLMILNLKNINEGTANDKTSYYRMTAALVAEMRDKFESLAKTLATNGVIEGALSRRLAAELIGLHQVTIGRLVKEFDRDGGTQQLPSRTSMAIPLFAKTLTSLREPDTIDTDVEWPLDAD